jgi:hypothetical protein
MVEEAVSDALKDLIRMPGWRVFTDIVESRIHICYKELGVKDEPKEMYRIQGKIEGYRDACLVIQKILQANDEEIDINIGEEDDGVVQSQQGQDRRDGNGRRRRGSRGRGRGRGQTTG